MADHDAEVIPIGTRGRPGRGTGNRPSTAARSLAPGRSAKRRPAEQPPVEAAEAPARSAGHEGEAPPADAQQAEGAAESGTGSPQEHASAPTAATAGGPDDDVSADRAGGSTVERASVPVLSIADRIPAGGVPVGDLLAALTSASKEVFGDDWERRLAQFLAFLRRRVSGDYEVDSYGFDAEVTEKLFLAAIRPLAEKWFRTEVRGVENIPASGGALVVSNHSGTVPLDALVTMFAVHDRTDRFLRALGADLVFRLPFVGNVARRGGATLACSDDAERMLRDGELVGVWPEGFKGIGKPYSERYKLQRFGRGGFVSAALRTGVPIVPLSVVGAEEIYPLVGNIPALARLLGVPYVPITPFFPLLGPLGLVPLPSKWILEFGEPIRTDTYDEAAAEDPMLVFDVTDQVRETVQQSLYKLLMERKSVFG